MKLRIATDTSSDFTFEEAKELGIDLIPLSINVDQKSFLEGIEISKDEFYDLLINQKKFPKTSQPSQQTFIDLFEDVKEKGEALLYISIASGLSGTYNTANVCKRIVGYEHIYILDGATLIAGLQILVKEALRLRDLGKDVFEIMDALNELKDRIVILACMNTLEYVIKGGRAGRIFGLIGNLINIKPILTFNNLGGAQILARPFGKVRAKAALIKEFLKREPDLDHEFFYYYSYNQENLDDLINKLKQAGNYVSGKIVNLSPAVGSHIGDNAYGLCYVLKKA